MKKRVVSMLLVMALLIGIFPLLTASAKAAGTCSLSTTGELRAALGTVLPELPAGTYFTTTGGKCTGHSNESTCATAVNLTYSGGSTYIDLYGATQCLSFAYYCMYRYTGVSAEQQHKLVYKQISSCDGIVETHTDDMRSFSEAEIKDILINLPAGSHLRIYRGSYNHSMILLSASDSSVTIYDCNRYNNYHCQVRVEEKSYQWMTDYINGSGSGRHGFSYIHSPVETHVHDMQTFLPHPACCNWPGMTRVFYQCMSCQKIYLDQAGTREITFDQAYDLPIDPNHHDSGTEIRNAKAATDTEAGYTGDTYCKGCGKLIAKGEAILSGTSHKHTLVFHEAMEGNCHQLGRTASYYYCTGCKKFFRDKACTIEQTSAQIFDLPKNPNNHDGDTEVRNAKEGTDTEDGYTGDVYCKGCGKMIAKGTSIPSGDEANKETTGSQTGTQPGAQQEMKFLDVPDNAWFTPAVKYATEHGLMAGMSGTIFDPGSYLTRAMLAQILYNKEGCPDVSSSEFDDVGSGAWYANAVSWAAGKGIVSGYGDRRFGPNDSITREQLVVILWRYNGSPLYGGDWRGDRYTDTNEISNYADTAMMWAVATGLISGSDGKLMPKATANRAQVAQILMNYFENNK